MQRFIVGLILLNAAVLGLETSQDAMERWGDWLKVLDRAILAVFVAEIGLKLYGRGWAFFRSGWNVFDFLVVGIGLLPASGPLSVLRALRLLRVLSMVPRLRFIVEALLRSIPGISSIALLMLILFYVAAVMATGFFGERFPDWFGTLGASMYTLFQVMTLESWSMGIARPVMAELPFAWVFFVPFILIATFTILNLFIAIIVNTMQNLYEREQEHEVAAIEEVVQRDHDQVADELRALRAEVAALREALATSGTATRVDRGRDPA
ncbi:ion transporter [Thiococcus pfennigii]|jgi:voltage-gated sodium channel|uniref:ion transporter n=1 Tax=Thiococcus pfennigii TaxID=1057 RepID=UPI0019064A0E|nr:ion transporter [Thiococcus pfennigii]MBK1702578.1 voltage-gated sodium channel [Thiococcus pfennigii]MBK1732823.1 voltage-gated sodium channel [Thiococcus pfennigii]